ncbi:alpha-L-rhamnosidase C-terminal domain-containing protein [uncultured Pedobacter sp.]|uniref:alpha-L-rhamnosidase-related protein n=1 Tax=uncultured Pedobacter sp. TaxID=246139 RepID=UPI00262A8A9E|nr:alpha-L-rhamnosidase C-terminal domain-containing protein [uncultured Pedobacter sp.]
MFKKISLLFCLAFLTNTIKAQDVPVNPNLLKKQWAAWWITCPEVAQRDYGVYHFRKDFSITSAPKKFIIHVSADNRYRLFVNGKDVCNGPARGDLYNWYFESIDIAPYLKAGANVIAAQVWNMGTLAPVAQISNQTAFVLQGDNEAEAFVNTNSSWKVIENKAYKPCSIDNGERLKTYMVIGPGDDVNANLYPWNWEKLNYKTTNWKKPQQIANPVTAGYGTDNLWTLVPRNIPLITEKLQRMGKIARFTGIKNVNNFLGGSTSLTIPPNSKVSILVDQNFNTVAYPELLLNGGKGSSVKVTYAEALFKDGVKGNRNDIAGKEIIGNFDIFNPDGAEKRLFRPLWLRTYRYIQLDIVTKEKPLVINDFYGMQTGYPFKPVASFASNDHSLQDIWKVGWRTAELCAGETYYDCPYYEQLQYEGDTRIQALISLYVTGDDRLMRKALLDFYHSRVPEGLTQGRYPSNRLQVIPPFSLYWVSMVHDYWLHRNDDEFLKQFLLPMEEVLKWYENNVDQQKQMLGPMKWWNFTDWNTAFDFGVPDGANDGNSSIITLQYAYTLQQAAKVFKHFGRDEQAKRYEKLAESLSASTYKLCYDATKGVLANTPLKNSYSQHASIMGVLANAIPEADEKVVLNRVLTDQTLSQATFYYRFYLTLALKKAGMADMYYSQLKPWREMLQNGLTTFAENPDPTRSDCHAWSASPNYDFLATICGIMPDAAGFKKVLIKPSLGELTEVSGNLPHPQGMIKVEFKRVGDGLHGRIELPGELSGSFVWNGKSVNLHPGMQLVRLD